MITNKNSDNSNIISDIKSRLTFGLDTFSFTLSTSDLLSGQPGLCSKGDLGKLIA